MPACSVWVKLKSVANIAKERILWRCVCRTTPFFSVQGKKNQSNWLSWKSYIMNKPNLLVTALRRVVLIYLFCCLRLLIRWYCFFVFLVPYYLFMFTWHAVRDNLVKAAVSKWRNLHSELWTKLLSLSLKSGICSNSLWRCVSCEQSKRNVLNSFCSFFHTSDIEILSLSL